MAAAETIDIIEDDAAHRAATKLQSQIRGNKARRRVDDMKTARLTAVESAFSRAMANASQGQPKNMLPSADINPSMRHHIMNKAKSDAELAEEEAMNDITVKKAMQKLHENDLIPWTQRNSFSMSVGFVIFLNAVCMGVEADFGTTYPDVFLVIEHIFTAVFFFELMCHFQCIGPRAYFSDHMNWLDFSLVALSVVDVWIIGPIGIDADLRMMSLFRMLRLIRLARLLRLLRMFKELTLLVNGFVASVKTLFWALVFLLIMVYIFSIFARQTIGGGDFTLSDDITFGDETRLFGTVDKTMLTLFVCLTEGCGMDVIHPTVIESPALILFWATFVFFTTYGLLNLIVGCFCENAMQLANENEKEMLESRDQQRMHILRHMKEAFDSMDDDHTGTISKKEFTQGILSNRTVMNALTELGLDSEENLFDLLDSENLGVITFDQFFDGASLIMKGQETAKAKDIVKTQLTTVSMQRRTRNMDMQMSSLRKDVNNIRKEVANMSNMMNMLITSLSQQGVVKGNFALPVTAQPSAEAWMPTHNQYMKQNPALQLGSDSISRDGPQPPNTFTDSQHSVGGAKPSYSYQDVRNMPPTPQPMPEPDLTPTAIGKDDMYKGAAQPGPNGPTRPILKQKSGVTVATQADLGIRDGKPDITAVGEIKKQDTSGLFRTEPRKNPTQQDTSGIMVPPAAGQPIRKQPPAAGQPVRNEEPVKQREESCGSRNCGQIYLWS